MREKIIYLMHTVKLYWDQEMLPLYGVKLYCYGPVGTTELFLLLLYYREVLLLREVHCIKII